MKVNNDKCFLFLSTQNETNVHIENVTINPLMPGGNKKVTHTQLSAAGLFEMCDLFVTTRH